MSAFLMAVLLFPTHWAAYYSADAPRGGFSGFQLLVLDSDAHPPLSSLPKGCTSLGYLSIGEIENNRAHFGLAKEKGILAGENGNWKGSFFVDMRNPWWNHEVRTLVNGILQQGFDGVFLDTIDDAEYLESQDGRRYAGMQDAMVQLIRDIRREFPHIPIAVNRGFSLLPKIGSSIDYLLAESIRTGYDFTAKTYHLLPSSQYSEQVQLLRLARQGNPRLTILTLDYWNPQDLPGIARIYREQRANGFSPYVSTIRLNEIVREPSH